MALWAGLCSHSARQTIMIPQVMAIAKTPIACTSVMRPIPVQISPGVSGRISYEHSGEGVFYIVL